MTTSHLSALVSKGASRQFMPTRGFVMTNLGSGSTRLPRFRDHLPAPQQGLFVPSALPDPGHGWPLSFLLPLRLCPSSLLSIHPTNLQGVALCAGHCGKPWALVKGAWPTTRSDPQPFRRRECPARTEVRVLRFWSGGWISSRRRWPSCHGVPTLAAGAPGDSPPFYKPSTTALITPDPGRTGTGPAVQWD